MNNSTTNHNKLWSQVIVRLSKVSKLMSTSNFTNYHYKPGFIVQFLRVIPILLTLNCYASEDESVVSSAPVSERSSLVEIPDVQKRDVSKDIWSLKRMYFDDDEVSAVATYPLSGGVEIAWDNYDRYFPMLDREFFRETSKKAIAGGLVFGSFGLLVSSPSCGYIIDKTGDFLDIAIEGKASDVLVSWIVITTTPSFVQQSYNLGKGFVELVFNERRFVTRNIDDKEEYPKLLGKEGLHYLLYGVLGVSSVINAAIPAIMMERSEVDYPIFMAATMVPFYSAWLQKYFEIGRYNIDKSLLFYRYTSTSNYQKRQNLKNSIVKFKEHLASSDKLANLAYSLIESRKSNEFAPNNSEPFAFSLLFLKSVNRFKVNDDEAKNESLMMNFKADVDIYNKASFIGNCADWASTFLTGSSAYTSYVITGSVLESLFLEVGISSPVSKVAAYTLSGVEALYSISSSQHIQREWLMSLKDIFTVSDNFGVARKLIGLSSFVNASLFALPRLVAGLSALKAHSLESKIVHLAPAFLIDVMQHDWTFNRYTNECLDNLSTIKSSNIGTVLQRAHINKYANQAIYYIDEFDNETIEKLYVNVMHGM